MLDSTGLMIDEGELISACALSSSATASPSTSDVSDRSTVIDLIAPALNLAFLERLIAEDWQLQQALVATSLCSPDFKLMLSLDGNVLPTATIEHARTLAESVVSFYAAAGGAHVLRRGKHQKAVLGTFAGGDALFGGIGWGGFLGMLKERGVDVSSELCCERIGQTRGRWRR